MSDRRARGSLAQGISTSALAALLVAGVASAAETEDGTEQGLDSLRQLLGSADRIVVTQEPGEDSPELYASTEARDIVALRLALAMPLSDDSAFEEAHCFCSGTPAIHLYRGADELGVIANHHGLMASWAGGTVRIHSPQPWLVWFDERGMSGPRAEYEEAATVMREAAVAEERWLAAMPDALVPLWPNGRQQGEVAEMEPLRAALVHDMPDEGERARALLAWYGSGAGPWSGYPVYESVAEKLLLDLPVSVVIQVARQAEASEAQLEGAARFFAMRGFESPPPDQVELPASLRARLLEHAMRSDDEDKRARAKAAFEIP